ncbi:hypothetical protein A4R43_26150 [Amycolatopsis albispora]|uniref:HTH marR-type domain-containing protein n=1 Tax=Amycolatopsis albispora TaxID=1804986 RepID=A0A344LBW9_9PSEU|nr:hypothetical protein A4R43_26150 [Amycolatopsis albispora]
MRCSERGQLQMLTLADRLGVTRGGRIIDWHVERGRVRRDRPEHNRREVYAVLTDEGGEVLDRAREVYLRVLSETLAESGCCPGLSGVAHPGSSV